MFRSFFSFSAALFLTLPVMISGADESAPEPYMPYPEAALPIMKKAPVIDGVIKDAEWAGSVRIVGYNKFGTEELLPARAVYRLGTDGKNLYFCAQCEAPANGIVCNVAPRKENTLAFLDDSYEFIFISAPAPKTVPEIRQLFINANGAKYARKIKDNQETPWPVSPVSSSKVDKGEWSFEMSIPLASLGVTDFSRNLGIRLGRIWRHLSPGINCLEGRTALLNGEKELFSMERVPIFRFRKKACAVEMMQLSGNDPGKYELKLKLVNSTDSPIPVKIVISGKPQNSQPSHFKRKMTIPAKSNKIVTASGPVIGEEMITSSINVTSPDGKSTYFKRNFKWQRNSKAVLFQKPDGEAERIALRFTYLPSYNKLHITTNLSTLKDSSKITRIHASVLDHQGTVIAERDLASPNSDGISETFWEIPDLRPLTVKSGNSLYTLSVKYDGIKDCVKNTTFYRDAMEWEGNQIGKNPDIQIAPFTPITFDGMTLGTIGKKHTLTETGLWKQVEGGGKTILRGDGMVLEAVKGGKIYPVTAKNFKVVKQTKTRLETESDIVCNILKGKIKAFWEDDGQMRWKMTLTSGSADRLRLTVKFDGSIARIMHACTDGIRFNYGGIIPEGTGCVWDGTKAPRNSIIGSYVPYIFIGNALQGIAVYGENDAGWTQNSELPAQQIFRNKDGSIDLVMNLFASPCQIKSPRTIDIGFLGTPIKPMPKNWREKRNIAFLGACYYWGTYSACSDIFPRNEDITIWYEMASVRFQTGKRDSRFLEQWLAGYQGAYPAESAADSRQRECWARHISSGFQCMESVNAAGSGTKIMVYTNARGMNFYTESGRTYCDQWTTYASMNRAFDLCSTVSYELDPDEFYRDLAAWWYQRMFESKAIDYLYWDDTFMQSNFTLGACAAYKLPDGRIQPASGIYNQRELVRRGAAVQTEMGLPMENCQHMTNAALAPVASYVQTHLDWEDTMAEKDFQDRYSRENIQAITAGRQYGVIVNVLGPIHSQTEDGMKHLIRSGLGVCLTHELANWTHGQKEYQKYMELLRKFGYEDPGMKVWNYWDDNYPLKITGGPTSSLIMARKGRALLVVCDYGEGGEFTVEPDLHALGLKAGFQAVNLENRQPVSVQGGKIRFSLAKHDFTIMLLK